MRPYLAILIDSLREAVHSRVLLVVLVLITLFLLALAPITLEEQATIGLKEIDVLSWTDLVRPLLIAEEEKNDDKPNPAKHVLGKLNEKGSKALKTLGSSEIPKDVQDVVVIRKAAEELLDALDDQIKEKDWYEPEPFQKVRLAREGRELVERRRKGEQLSLLERQRLNRLALEASFPESIRVSPAKQLAFGYAFSEQLPLPITREQLNEQLPAILIYLIDVLFGIFGMLAALLVTASIIPQLFEPGSLHLLLSKPVSRSLLYITKFIGGCTFALLSVAYLSLGLWLVLGLRMQYWEPKLLAAIPVYGFVFAIYYSVTALAGLVYRNTIVAVVAGILFWGMCFGLGFAKVNALDPFLVRPTTVNRIAAAGDSIIAVRMDGVREWDEANREWKQIYQSQQEGNELFSQTFPEFGPFYDAKNEQLISVQRSFFRGPDPMVSTAQRSALWTRSTGAALPAGVVSLLLDNQSRVVVVTLDGIYRSIKDVSQADNSAKVLGFSLPFGGSGSFEKISNGDWEYRSQPVIAAIDPKSNALAIFSRGRLSVWNLRSDGNYAETKFQYLEEEEKTEGTIAIAGDRLVLASDDGRLLVFNARSLESEFEAQPEGKSRPRQVHASPKGNALAVLFDNGSVWTLSAEEKSFIKPAAPGQGSVRAIAFELSGQLLVAHNVNLVSRFDLETSKRELICRPKLNMFEQVTYYGVYPLYTVLPKPGEVRRTLIYLVTGETTEKSNDRERFSQVQPVVQLDPWQPVWSGAIFIALLVGLGCVLIERMEF